MPDKEEFEKLLNEEFNEIENLLEKHHLFIKDYRDKESIKLIMGRLETARKKLLENCWLS